MSDNIGVKTGTEQRSLRRRMQEIEAENSRLSEEMKEREHLEEALRESELRFRTMADGTPFIIWVTDSTGKMEFVNKAYVEFLGVTLDQVKSGGWQMLVHPDDHTSYVNLYMACLRERSPFQAQARVLRRDGHWRWVISQGQPRFSERGEFLGMAGSSLDITEYIETANALRESEMKFRGAFENAAIGYALQTPEGTFLEANPAYCNLLGYSIDELHHLKFFQLLHPEDRDKHMQVVEQLLAREISHFVIESRYLHKNGNIVWIRKSCSLAIDVHGEPKHMISLIEDITEYKQAEESKIQLQVQQKLMEQREQERLLISQDIHDGPIQTLSATIFELEIARQQFHDSTAYPQLIRIGLNIKHTIQELRNIIAALRPPLLQRFGLSQAMRVHTDDLNARYPELKLTHDVVEDQGKLSEAVCLSLFRIYQEALSNVVRHSGATAANIQFSFGEDMAVLAIEDNGRGMEVVSDLMEKTAKGHYGLAGMKERTQAINGELQVLSTLGKGTTILVKVPLNNH